MDDQGKTEGSKGPANDQIRQKKKKKKAISQWFGFAVLKPYPGQTDLGGETGA